jgi:hypothetical protein
MSRSQGRGLTLAGDRDIRRQRQEFPMGNSLFQSMSRENVQRFCEKDMRKQKTTAGHVNPNQRDLLSVAGPLRHHPFESIVRHRFKILVGRIVQLPSMSRHDESTSID